MADITYTKVLKTLAIKTLGGTEITVADTAADPKASDALAEFEAFHTMHVRTNNAVAIIPFHAVVYVRVTSTTAQATKGDPYGCVTDNGSDNEETPGN